MVPVLHVGTSKRYCTDMKKFNKSIFCVAALLAGMCATSCEEANEFADTNTANPTWGDSHPETLASSVWVRGKGMKYNAFGEEIQGFVESIDFYRADSCVVKMSEGVTKGTWTDESNTESTPRYEYTYSNVTGTIEILKESRDDKGKVSKTTIFTGVAAVGKPQVITMSHFGDTPQTTYLVKK